MKAVEISKEALSLNTVLRRFKQWRGKRVGSERIPENLWRAAIDLTHENPISRVSRELRLDYYELKDRVNGEHKSKSSKAASPFVELKMDDSEPVKKNAAAIEIEDGRGMRVKIALPQAGVSALLEWASRLWESEQS